MEAHNQVVPWGINRVFGDEIYSFDTWELKTGTGVGVAVLDTGIDCRHPDLRVVGGVNTVDNTNYCSDRNGHGTHVAGTISALDNDRGVVGVAPDIDLYGVKVLSDNGGGTSASVANGILWAIEQDNVKIINMSLGGGHSLTMERAVADAYEAGVLLVASAGNSGSESVSFPAAYSNVIAVSATNNNDGFASFSSFGSEVELTAPGVSVLSTLPRNSYGSLNGTSMASPHVAGVAALVWGADSSLSNSDVRAVLQNTAQDIELPVKRRDTAWLELI